MARDARPRWPWYAGGAALLVAVVAGLVWFLGGSEPDEVDLGRLVGDGPDDREATDPPDGDAGDDPAAGASSGEPEGDADAGGSDDAGDGEPSIDGVWRVTTEAIAFDRAAGAGSFVGYRVDEELSGIGATTAVGRSPAVDGSVTIEQGVVVAAEVVADLTQLTSDDGRRDGRVRSTLGSDSSATFVLTEPIDGLELDPDGAVTSLDARGSLTIEGVTREVTVDLQAARLDGFVVIAGSMPIVLSEFGVQAPSAPIVLSVSDDAVIEWQLYLSPAAS